jgi:serine/threonine protein kinase
VEPTLIAGRYRLVELLGRGGMSEVWLAEDEELERKVALKLVAPNADWARFEREARAAASLAHENVMQLYDFGEAGGRPFMVLEYLAGGTLEERLQSGRPLPDEETERIATELAAGLAHAHSRGLVHRDLKPANVLFDDEGRAKIADFGIARMEGGLTLTEAGTVLGTAAYISPEQAGGGTTSPASDVYAFGVLLFRMLTGRLPFEAAHPVELVELHRDAEPPRVRELRADAPFALAALADDSLAKNPQARPQDGGELLARLAPSTTAPVAAPLHVEEPTQVVRPARTGRRAVPIAVGLVALAAAGIGAAYALTRPGGNSSTPAPPTTTQLHSTRARTHTTATTTPATSATTQAVTEATTSSTTAATTTHLTTTRPATTSFGTTTYSFTSTADTTVPTDTDTTPTTDTTDTTATTDTTTTG